MIKNRGRESIHVRCKLVARSSWYPDANNDGVPDVPNPEVYKNTKRFREMIPSKGRTRTTHRISVAHPDKGAESSQIYGNDHFSGWEYNGTNALITHCHRL
jgi:hypothetical protein